MTVIFEQATRKKLRFQTKKGSVSSEDLWDLSLAELNETAKVLNREIKSTEEEDFLEKTSNQNTLTKLKFDVVLHILNTKKEEKESKKNASIKQAEAQKLMEILSRKQDANLESLSEEELKKKIAELS